MELWKDKLQTFNTDTVFSNLIMGSQNSSLVKSPSPAWYDYSKFNINYSFRLNLPSAKTKAREVKVCTWLKKMVCILLNYNAYNKINQNIKLFKLNEISNRDLVSIYQKTIFLKYVHLDVFKIYFGFPLLSTAKTASYFLDLNTVNAKKKDRLLILHIKEIALAIVPNSSIRVYEENVLFIVILCQGKPFNWAISFHHVHRKLLPS